LRSRTSPAGCGAWGERGLRLGAEKLEARKILGNAARPAGSPHRPACLAERSERGARFVGQTR